MSAQGTSQAKIESSPLPESRSVVVEVQYALLEPQKSLWAGQAACGHLGVVERSSESAELQVGQRVLIAGHPMQPKLTLADHACLPLGEHEIAVETAMASLLSAYALDLVRDSGIQLGDPALVVGDGPIAQLVAQWARLQGAMPLIVVAEEATDQVERITGCDHRVDLNDARKMASQVERAVGRQNVRVVWDAIGRSETVGAALQLLQGQGRLVLMASTSQDDAALNAYPDLHRRELSICGAPTFSRWIAACQERHPWQEFTRLSLDFLADGRLVMGRPFPMSVASVDGSETSETSASYRIVDWTTTA